MHKQRHDVKKGIRQSLFTVCLTPVYRRCGTSLQPYSQPDHESSAWGAMVIPAGFIHKVEKVMDSQSDLVDGMKGVGCVKLPKGETLQV